MSGVTPLLEAVRLGKHFDVGGHRVAAVQDASLAVCSGETLAIVGESGAGKSTLGRLLLGLEPGDTGVVHWDGIPVHRLKGSALRRARRRFQPVFQNPHGSLNPRMTVAGMLGEVVRSGGRLRGAAVATRVTELLQTVGLSGRFGARRPGELSGGEAQRVAIVRAMAAEPRVLILDEPFSALDPVTGAALVNRLLDWQQRARAALVFITHDLGVVGHLADRVAVMHRGRIVENAPAPGIFENPAHPYTRALLESVPGRARFPGPGSRSPALATPALGSE